MGDGVAGAKEREGKKIPQFTVVFSEEDAGWIGWCGWLYHVGLLFRVYRVVKANGVPKKRP